MRETILFGAVLLLATTPSLHAQSSESTAPASSASDTSYKINVSVNEVGILFHATDVQHRPVLDLKPEEIDLFDNGAGPGKIISLERLGNDPVRAAVLIDTSSSVSSSIFRSRAEAKSALQELVVQASDQGLVETFRRGRHVIQDWTNQQNRLTDSLSQSATAPQDSIDGTAVFDVLFSTCSYSFDQASPQHTKNVIVLFSDGVDTASSVAIRSALEKCREKHVSIYAFSPEPRAPAMSSGPPTLREVTAQTGGRLFYLDGTDANFQADLAELKMDLLNAYLLIYKPDHVQHDGAFHKVVLVGPRRVATIVSPSGFFAPGR